MNSDFNYNPAGNSGGQQPFDPSHLPEPQPDPKPVVGRGGSSFGKKFLKFIGLLLLLGLVAGGAYYYQQSRIDATERSKAPLFQEIDSLKQKLAKDSKSTEDTPKPGSEPDPNTPVSQSAYNIVTGPVTSASAANPTVEILYLPGTVSEVWVELGTKPDALTLQTKHLKDGLGLGIAGQYARQPFGFTDLQAGTNYFYRAAAVVDGKTVYGGVAAFTTAK